jgi:hypothetical protein
MTPVAASPQVPIDQVEVRPRSSIGAERARQSLSSPDILPTNLDAEVGIWQPPYHIFIKRVGCRANIANSLNRRPNLRCAAEVSDTRDHFLPPTEPLLGTQDIYVALAL